MACRDMERAQAALKEVIEISGNENVVCMKLDLADSKSIKEFAEAINKGKRLCPPNKLIQLFQSCTVVSFLRIVTMCLLQESLNSTSSSTTLVWWFVPMGKRKMALRCKSVSITWVNTTSTPYPASNLFVWGFFFRFYMPLIKNQKKGFRFPHSDVNWKCFVSTLGHVGQHYSWFWLSVTECKEGADRQIGDWRLKE